MTRNPSPSPAPDNATPRPWRAITEGSYDQKHAAAKAFEAVMATRAPDCDGCEFTDLTWLRDDTDAVQIALVGNGPKATENAALIVEAVNAYDRLRRALTDILALAEGEAPLLEHYRREIERIARAALQEGSKP